MILVLLFTNKHNPLKILISIENSIPILLRRQYFFQNRPFYTENWPTLHDSFLQNISKWRGACGEPNFRLSNLRTVRPRTVGEPNQWKRRLTAMARPTKLKATQWCGTRASPNLCLPAMANNTNDLNKEMSMVRKGVYIYIKHQYFEFFEI